MGAMDSATWMLAFLAILAGAYLLYVKAGVDAWFSLVLLGSGLLLLVGVSMTVASTRSGDSAAPSNGLANDDNDES